MAKTSNCLYSPEQVEKIVAIWEANGRDFTKTASDMGIPRTSLYGLLDRFQRIKGHDIAGRERDHRYDSFTGKTWKVIFSALDQLRGKRGKSIDHKAFRDVSIGICALYDKILATNGGNGVAIPSNIQKVSEQTLTIIKRWSQKQGPSENPSEEALKVMNAVKQKEVERSGDPTDVNEKETQQVGSSG